MGFVLDLFYHVIMNILHFLHFVKQNPTLTTKGTLNINIKTNNGNTLAVGLDPKCDIKNVKEIVAPRLGLAPENIKIIFAGKELHDSIVIEECDLGEQSILHAVRTRTTRTRNPEVEIAEEGSKPLCETLIDLQLTDGERLNLRTEQEREAKRALFWVYCAAPCRNLCHGKLRVRCSTCHSGAFTVDRDPQNWDDVLLNNQITGICEDETCLVANDGPHYAEFFFKCKQHTSEGEEDQAVPLYLVKTNFREVPCLACTDVCTTVLVFPCSSGHVTCIDCFKAYCNSRLGERQFWSHPEYGYTIGCPAGCPDSFISEIHHFRILSSAQYDRYQKYATEEYVLQAGGVLCPHPGCGMGILADPSCRRITCSTGCGMVFCRNCLQDFHIGECLSGEDITSGDGAGGCEYNIDPNRVAQARWDEASKVAIKTLTKRCPKCRTPTERDGGCMHMVCTRPQCGFHWCWICQTPWARECMGNHWFG